MLLIMMTLRVSVILAICRVCVCVCVLFWLRLTTRFVSLPIYLSVSSMQRDSCTSPLAREARTVSAPQSPASAMRYHKNTTRNHDFLLLCEKKSLFCLMLFWLSHPTIIQTGLCLLSSCISGERVRGDD